MLVSHQSPALTCRLTARTSWATRAWVAWGACTSRQNRRSKWIWRGVMRDGAGLRPRFHSLIIRVRRPRPLNEHTHSSSSSPRKDDQGQSPCCSLMRGDRWEEGLQTLPIKLTFLGSVCVFSCACGFFESQPNLCKANTVRTHTHTHTVPGLWPSCTSWQAGVKAVGAELSGQQEMVLRYLSACPGS